MTILSFTAAVFGGLMLAISSAWDHSTSLEDSRRQAQSAHSRIRWMIQQAGTYRVSGQSTTPGIGVVSTTWGFYQAPTILVVWSGGSSGGMNAQGLQARLPLASELVVFAPDTNPARLVEVTFPGNSTAIDFRAANFASSIQTLMASNTRKTILLSDRIHVVPVQGSLPALAAMRFEIRSTPTDSQISSVVVGSQNWNDLPWGGGLVSADRGLRTINVSVELMLDPDPNKVTTDCGYTTAIPFLGSVNRQYVYQP
jgi:hypothetical protein